MQFNVNFIWGTVPPYYTVMNIFRYVAEAGGSYEQLQLSFVAVVY